MINNINEDLKDFEIEIDSLVFDPANARTHDEKNIEAIKGSLARFGQRSPIVVQKEGRIVRAGNGRLAAAKQLGWTKIAALVVDDDEVTATAYAIADNRTGELAQWDRAALGSLLSTLDEDLKIGWDDLDLAQFQDFEIGDEETAIHDLDDLERLNSHLVEKGSIIEIGSSRLACFDCLEYMRTLPSNSIDAIVTDPPYGIGFMGKDWDQTVPSDQWSAGCLRILKPGGYVIAFAATRTIHRLTVAIEDAGFEIRDQINWLYWNGFPKSHDAAKQIDKQKDPDTLDRHYVITGWIKEQRDKAGLTNKKIDDAFGANGMARHWTDTPPGGKQPEIPTLENMKKILDLFGNPDVPPEIADLLVELNDAKGKPGETWFRREVVGVEEGVNKIGFGRFRDGETKKVVYNKTKAFKKEAKKWVGWGTGLKPATEPAILARKPMIGTLAENLIEHSTGAINIDGCRYAAGDPAWPHESASTEGHEAGRWPANVYHCTKPDRKERDQGCDDLGDTTGAEAVNRKKGSAGINNPRAGAGRTAGQIKNFHPTVKPINLMRWLVRLVTPPGGVVLDPFLGSGTTCAAAIIEGRKSIGIEVSPAYAGIARARMESATESATD